MKIAIIRGSYFNKFEMQNYEPLAKKYQITGFSGKKPMHNDYAFPLTKLFCPVDLPKFPYKMSILNRLCLGDAMYLLGLEKKLKGFDIAHVRETYFHFTRQALKAKQKGLVKKVVCTCSETIAFNNEGIWQRKSFKKQALKEVDKFHCLTKRAKTCLIKEGCDPKKIVVFPYGIDLNKFKPRKESVINNRQSVINILFVGRLHKEKGVYDLLKVFVQLIKQRYRVHLTIIGDGLEKENIINLINQTKLDRYISIKKSIYNDIYKEYQKADIFCFLSKPTKYGEERFGMSLLEAMACGLAIVTTKCGAIPEVIYKSGLVVKPGNWRQAFRAVKKLIDNKKLRKSFGIKARNGAEKRFDYLKTAKNIEKLWLSV